MDLVAADASGLDFLEALDDAGAVVIWRQQRIFGLRCRQVEGGAAVTLRDAAGALVCIVGLYADDAGAAEAWFAAGPAMRANLLAAVRRARALLDQVGTAAAPVTARAYVRPEGVAGARLARWLGFADAGLQDTALGRLRRFERRFEKAEAR